jgi:hypothetical protein
MKPLLAFVLASFVALPATVGDHPGHGEIKVMSGKVIAIQAERIQIEFFDRASFSTKLVWVFVDDKTKVTAGKTRLALTDLKLQQDIDCMAETEIGKDETTVLRAVQIRLKQQKSRQ